ncbi:HAD hydrolase family protein [Leuconostoc sp. MS02]|uniref:HAD hydrolase family protein n=1 Tax=Leuconostoc aquikimchii TaxID=3236804 RepID=A0ABV3S3S2_9LACO
MHNSTLITDFDGTLPNDLLLSSATVEQLNTLNRKDIRIIIATGPAPAVTDKLLSKYQINAEVIGIDGAL